MNARRKTRTVLIAEVLKALEKAGTEKNAISMYEIIGVLAVIQESMVQGMYADAVIKIKKKA